MRDNLISEISDETLLNALLWPRVLVVADAATLCSKAAQTALVTTVLLLLRTGATVAIAAPDVAIRGAQPPLSGDRLVTALTDIGADLIDGVRCLSADGEGAPTKYDVVIGVGDVTFPSAARAASLVLRLSADAVTARMTAKTEAARAGDAHEMVGAWDADLQVPFGALAAAGLAASEVFKFVMRTLESYASDPEIFRELFAVSTNVTMSLDPQRAVPHIALVGLADLGAIDVVSGGAIAQAFLYCVARLPDVRAQVRVIEPEAADVTNLNRYALLRRSTVGLAKADALAAMPLGGIHVTPVIARYDHATPTVLGGLASAVVVGVDHIPTRWAAQKARPEWLGVGATSHYSAMSSDHSRGTPCTWCLHPADAPDLDHIPTVAFVSHWAGLLVAWRFVRHRVGVGVSLEAQYDFFTPLRPDLAGSIWRSPVARRLDCPNRCAHQQHAAA